MAYCNNDNTMLTFEGGREREMEGRREGEREGEGKGERERWSEE